MTPKELQEYRDNFLKNHPAPEVKILQINETYINVPGTADRTPAGGFSWINYWRAMSGVHYNDLVCSHCGVAIKAELSANDPADTQAHGAHVIRFIKNAFSSPYSEFPLKTYITPLCRKCNNFNVRVLSLRQGSIIVEEFI